MMTEPEEFEFVKTEPQELEVMNSESQEIQFMKTELQEVDVPEMMSPEWIGPDAGAGNEPVVMEIEPEWPYYAQSSELKSESLYVEETPVSQILGTSVETDHPILLETRQEQLEYKVIKEEEERNRISLIVNPGELFSSDQGELMYTRQPLSESDGIKCDEEYHCEINTYRIKDKLRSGGDSEKLDEDQSSPKTLSKNDKTEKEQCTSDTFVKQLTSSDSSEVELMVSDEQIPYKCDISGKQTSSIKNKSFYSSDSTRQRQYICEECSLCYISKSHLEQHVQNVHQRMKLDEYQKYEENFLKHHSMSSHILTVQMKEKQCDCDVCGDDCSFKETTELEKKQFKCPQCEKRFCHRSSIKTHVDTVHLKKKQFECPHCEQKFGHCSSIKTHVEMVHLKKKPFQCPQCEQKFAYRWNMKTHFQIVHLKKKQFECSQCKKRFVQSYHMQKHAESTHKEMQFECSNCEKRFGHSSNMKTHIAIVHLKKKQFECPHCKHRFAYRSHMTRHVQTVHLKMKRFECPHCEQRFSQSGSLKTHVEIIHLKKKQFQCPHCKQRFSRSHHMQRHVKSMHVK